MKKRFLIICLVLFLIPMALIFSGCSNSKIDAEFILSEFKVVENTTNESFESIELNFDYNLYKINLEKNGAFSYKLPYLYGTGSAGTYVLSMYSESFSDYKIEKSGEIFGLNKKPKEIIATGLKINENRDIITKKYSFEIFLGGDSKVYYTVTAIFIKSWYLWKDNKSENSKFLKSSKLTGTKIQNQMAKWV